MFLKTNAYTSAGAYEKGQKVTKTDKAFDELNKAGLLVESKDEIDPKVETLLEKIARLEKEIEKGWENKELVEKIEILEKEIEDLTEEKNTLQSNVDDLTEEKAVLETTVNDLNEATKDLKEKLDSSIADNEELTKALKETKKASK